MRSRGFTLIEVLIALSLMILLAGLMTEFGFDLASRKEKLTSLSTRHHSVTALFQQIDRALTAADVHGQGVRVSENDLIITSRRVIAQPSLVEFDSLTVSFESGTGTLSAHTETQDGESSTPEVLYARFRAYDGEQWGPFHEHEGTVGLPQAIDVAVWFLPNSPDPESNETTDPEMPPSRAPDRWRVFGLIDTLAELGS